jgi:hypothetical protein
MPIDMPQDDTSVGPLDIAKAGGDEDGCAPASLGGHGHHSGTELLDADTTDVTQNSADRMKQKNPLGYSVTDATEEEIEKGRTSTTVNSR